MMALLLEGRFLFVTSPALLTEFQRVIRSEKLRDVFDEPDELVELVRSVAGLADDTQYSVVIDGSAGPAARSLSS